MRQFRNIYTSTINICVYTIIEDQSPYFVKFKFQKLSDIISYVKQISSAFYHVNAIYKGYAHMDLKHEAAHDIIERLPLAQKFSFIEERVSLFETYPGGGGGVHKDGSCRKVSFNIPIEINDDKCITKWYDDAVFDNYEVKDFPNSRNVFHDHTKMQSFPHAMSTVMKADEMMLFNTDIYHSFDNTLSDQWRVVPTLRLIDEDVSFSQAKEMLFN